MNNSTVPSKVTLPQPSLLVVDDRPENLQLLSSVLRKRYRVRVAMGGEIALKAIDTSPPDLILLDVLMPRMDGYQVCAHLKQDPKTQNIPVLFLSASARGQDKTRGFEVGGADYITKPFQTEEVFARIEHQLTIRSLKQQLEAEIQQRQQLERELERQNAQLEEIRQELQVWQCKES
ncbi:MAG: response regulator [Cyanobacteriota bacterium]|nr:response regulator [Cyanobacteriota bacterium]